MDVGDRLGRYRLIRALGRGGLATAWLVEDPFDPAVRRALKVVHRDREEDVEHLRREFIRLTGLRHPHLTCVHDFGRAGSRVFYTCDFIAGVSLARWADARPWSEIRQAMAGPLQALGFLHQLGIRHGDVTPSNILVDDAGRGVLIDLSCASVIGAPPTQAISGTREFIAPELLSAEPAPAGGIDGRADLFSLAKTIRSVAKSALPDNVDQLLSRMESDRLAERPATCGEVLQLLGISSGEPSSSDEGAPSDERAPSDEPSNERPPVRAASAAFGREAELSKFDNVLAGTMRGDETPRVLCICGPRGVGKTRLLREMKWRAQVRASAFEIPSRRRPTFSSELSRVLAETDSHPDVILIDDADQLDESSAAVLKAFCSELEPGGPLVVLSAASPQEFESIATTLPLGGLSQEHVEQWARPVVSAAVAAQLHACTAGMPFHIEYCLTRLEAGTHTEADIPTLAQEVSGASLNALSALSEPEKFALFAVANLGREASIRWLAQVGADAESLLALQWAGWIEASPRGWALKRQMEGPALVDALHAGLPSAVVRRLHRAVAERFQTLATESHDLPVRSEHLANAALQWRHAEADEEARRLVLAEVSDWRWNPRAWIAVAEDWVTSNQDFELGLALARILERGGRPELGLRHLAVLRKRNADRARIYACAAACSVRAGRIRAALRYATRARDFGEHAPVLVEATAIRVQALVQLGRYAEALSEARDELGQSGRSTDTDDAFNNSVLQECAGISAAHLGDLVQARLHLQKAQALHQGDPRAQIRVLSYSAIAEYRTGNLPTAQRKYEEALHLAEHHGIADQLASAVLNLATVRQRRGDWGAAIRLYERALRLATALKKSSTRVSSQFNLANLYCLAGAVARSRSLLEQMASEASSERLAPYQQAALVLRGDLARMEGDERTAREHYQAALDEFRQAGLERESAEMQVSLAELYNPADPKERSEIHERLANARLHMGADKPADLAARIAMRRAELAVASSGPASLTGLVESALESAAQTDEPELSARISLRAAKLFEANGAATLALDQRLTARRHLEPIAMSLPVPMREAFWTDFNRAGATVATTGATIEMSDSHGRRLRQILAINRRLNSSLEVDAVLEAALDAAIELTSAERGFVLLQARAGGWDVACARNFDREEVDRSHMKFSQGIAAQALESGEPVVSFDAQRDDRFRESGSVHAMRLKSVVAVPIMELSGTRGALYLDNRFQGGRFGSEDVALLAGFADQVALAMRNARLHSELQEKTRELQQRTLELETLASGQTETIAHLEHEVRARQDALELRYDHGRLVAQSQEMRQLLHTLDRVLDSELTVLITGESGTGKELIARSIHFNGPRSKRRFVALNCAAIPEALLESQLFGHVRGAFTGADRDHRGLFVQADGGTIFLDEVGEMPLAMQAKLLRVLQERRVAAVGATAEPTSIDVRVVCATNRDLAAEVAAGAFREDLYYRLAVVPVRVPPLRHRGDDFPALTTALLEELSPGRAPRITQEAFSALVAHSWPGNVRELRNVLARASLMCDGDVIRRRDVQLTAPTSPPPDPEITEATRLRQALIAARWNVAEVSRALGIPRNTLYRKLRRHGIERPA